MGRYGSPALLVTVYCLNGYPKKLRHLFLRLVQPFAKAWELFTVHGFLPALFCYTAIIKVNCRPWHKVVIYKWHKVAADVNKMFYLWQEALTYFRSSVDLHIFLQSRPWPSKKPGPRDRVFNVKNERNQECPPVKWAPPRWNRYCISSGKHFTGHADSGHQERSPAILSETDLRCLLQPLENEENG